MTCEHRNFLVDGQVGCLQLEEGGPIMGHVLDVSVRCSDCNQPFRFNWTKKADPHIIPLSLKLQEERPWLSGMGQILGCTISPTDELEPAMWGNVGYSGLA